jgi:hypothetical protein
MFEARSRTASIFYSAENAMAHRWTDDYLDSLRLLGDPAADEAVRRLMQDHETETAAVIFHRMRVNDGFAPAEHFPDLLDFFEATSRLPEDVDTDRLQRGERIFNAHLLTGALILLAKSLPEGYQAPNLAIILGMAGLLRTQTFKRLLGTLELVLNVTRPGEFRAGGKAIVTAQKLRLLHAGVRHVARTRVPEYGAQYGVAVNQEDLLGTIMGFSLLVILGMRALRAGWTAEQEEDFLYLWKVYAYMMGIHPDGDTERLDGLPENVDDAIAFYEAYGRRHYVAADLNPQGVALAAANRRMLETMVPRILRWLGMGVLPVVFMRRLMGAEACARLRITADRHPLLTSLYGALLDLFDRSDFFRSRIRLHIASALFQDLINVELNGEVTFTIPSSIRDLDDLIAKERAVNSR